MFVWLLGILLPAVGRAQPPETARAAVSMGSAAGCRRYRPGAWGVVGVGVTNPTDEAAETLAVVYFSDDPTLQYGRRCWIPAHSVLRTTSPIRMPDSVRSGENHVSLVSVPIAPVDGTDMSAQSHAERMGRSRLLIVDHEPMTVSILGDFDDLHPLGDDSPSYTGPDLIPPAPDDPVYEMILAAKRSQGLSRRMSAINAWDLPSDPAALNALDVLVLCSDRLAQDADSTALLRNWVLRGGNLWVMLDEVEQGSISAILGEAFASTIVDRLDLTELRIHDARSSSETDEGVSLELDDPVAFARVLPRGVTVTESVDGWPAAFWQPLGAGKVFYTTLGPAAWVRPTTPDDVEPAKKGNQTSFVARMPLQRFADLCFARRDPGTFKDADIQPFLAKQIGYRILRKEVVAAVLAGFCGILIASGLWFWKIGRTDRLLWVAPSLAAATTLMFLGVAVTARRSVPPTVALWQRVALEPGLATGQSRGLAALYNPEAANSDLGATRGGVFVPDMTAMSGQRRRMVWTDEGVWHWEDLKLPPGVRNAPFEHMIHLQDSVDCPARFGPLGLKGVLIQTPFKGLADAVIAVPGQPLAAANIRADGAFVSGTEDVLAPGEFMADKLPTVVQQRRKSVYRQLLGDRWKGVGDNRPTLFVWAESLDPGFTFPRANRLGSALLSMPVRIEPPAVGSNVTVPATFMKYRPVIGPGGRRSAACSPLTGEWGELKTPVTEWLRFQLPESVLPIELKRADVSLSIRAPSRLVEILALSEGEPRVVKELMHPVGTYRAVLDRPELLQLDDQGGLLISVRVGKEESVEPENLMAQATWLVESLQMEIVGTVQGE